MLDKIYKNSSEKGLKQALVVYGGLVISAIILPIVFLAIEYYLNGKIYFSKTVIIFLIIVLWSLINIDYLKKRMKTKGKSQ